MDQSGSNQNNSNSTNPPSDQNSIFSPPPPSPPTPPMSPPPFPSSEPQSPVPSIPPAPVPLPEQPFPSVSNETPSPVDQTPVPPQPETNTFGMPPAAAPTPFNPFASSGTGSQPSEPVASETVPTDLSNLVNTSPEAVSYMPQAEAPSVVLPQAPGGGMDQAVPASGGKGFPKILIIIGGVILLIVIGASAYFILGIGKPAEPLPVSNSIEQQPAAAPTAKLTPTPTVSTQSGSFSNLPGNPTVTPSGGGGGSAYDLLKKRPASTPSANP